MAVHILRCCGRQVHTPGLACCMRYTKTEHAAKCWHCTHCFFDCTTSRSFCTSRSRFLYSSPGRVTFVDGTLASYGVPKSREAPHPAHPLSVKYASHLNYDLRTAVRTRVLLKVEAGEDVLRTQERGEQDT